VTVGPDDLKRSFPTHDSTISYNEEILHCEGGEALASEAVAAPSLAGFRPRLDRALSKLVWWEGSLPVVVGLELDDL